MRAFVFGILALGVVATGVVAAKLYSSRGESGNRDSASALPAPPDAAFTIPEPRALETPEGTTQWAPVLRATTVRSAPGSQGRVLDRLETQTPEGTSNLVPVLARSEDEAGSLWMRVRIPALPSNREGWVRRVDLGGYTLVKTRLVVDLDSFRATLYSGGKEIFEASVGVGTTNAPTPRGDFYIRNQLSAYRSPFYGPLAFGTSARSPTLTDWPAGGFVGIHGTSRPELLPGRVSHGCIRMRNADILRLARLMPIGTPLTIT